MSRFDTILCPFDFDQNSVRALRVATELAQEREARLYLLHVVGMPPGPEVALPFGKIEAALERSSHGSRNIGSTARRAMRWTWRWVTLAAKFCESRNASALI